MQLLVFVLFALRQFSIPEALVLPNLYPFGPSEGDIALPHLDDGSSGEIPILVPFLFFGQSYDSLFVNTNGLISFLVESVSYTPDRLPLDDDDYIVIAPFWADVNIEIGGEIYYRESTDPQLLQRATRDVWSVYFDMKAKGFQAKWVLVATWYEVPFWGAYSTGKDIRNTYQAVLVTNEKESFAIFNYNDISWTTASLNGGDFWGLGGSPAQAGFNAGDGIKYFIIPGSATDAIINVTSTSNMGQPGRWMFRLDLEKIQGTTCNTNGSSTLGIFPSSVMMLGGDNIFIAGPCFEPSNVIVCEFPGGKMMNGSYISGIRASCPVPMLNMTGRLTVRMSVDGGRSFDYQGIVTSVNLNRATPAVVRLNPEKWSEDVPVSITWDPSHLGDETFTVAVLLARFSMRDDNVYFHSMFSLQEEQRNTGESQFIVPKGEGRGTEDDQFITLVQVKKISGNLEKGTAQWIWSDLFYWSNSELAEQRCMYWYSKQPDPKIFLEDASLLPCPKSSFQAQADRGRFIIDEYRNSANHSSVNHVDANLCFTTTIPSAQGAGRQCCYTERGNLKLGPPTGGSLNRFNTEAGMPTFSHFFQDHVPFVDCCLSSDKCERYFEKRPSDDSSRYKPPRPALGVGSTHMVSLDGTKYTFGGYGEYHVLQIPSIAFELQGRMQPFNDDSSILGTVFTAFAVKERGSDVVQVHITGSPRIVQILVNGDLVELVEQFSNMDFKSVTVSKDSNASTYSVVFTSGVTVTIQKVEDILNLMLLIPPTFKGATRGLLGLWDGNQENDFFLPDGSTLSHNSDQSTIHNKFGQQWATSSSDSIFTYDEGKKHSSYFNAEYVPMFLDKANFTIENATLGQQAKDVCGDSILCLFDVHTTGKISIGKATKQAIEVLAANINDTQTPGCPLLKNEIENGTTLRNETQDGEVIYRFHCSSYFYLNGSSVISCLRGQWNGSTPSCLHGKVQDKAQGKAGKASRGRPWYFIAAAAAGLVLFVLILIAWIVYCTGGRRSVAIERVEEDFTINNPAFVSGNTKHPDPDMNA